MQRVTRSTAVAVLPAPPASPGTPGYFTGGNPVGSVPATVPGYEWFNLVQEELVAPVLRAGLTLDPAVLDQVRRANDRLYGGGMRSVAANTTLTADDAGVVLVDASGAARTITLPAAASMNARPIPLRIVKTDGSANAVTIQRAGSDTIEGATSIALTTQWSSAALRSDGVNAWIHQVGLAASSTVRGTSRFATAAEADAGTLDTVACTPLSLGFATRSVANGGYQRLPGGVIIQWRRNLVFSTDGSGQFTGTWTFPLAFPTAVLGVAAVPTTEGSATNTGRVVAGAPTLTQLTLYGGGWAASGSGAVGVIVIGH